MVLKRVTASAGPSGQAVVGGARASAARNPFRARSGTGVPRCRNSSSRWRASSVPNAPDRTRSVAAARAMRGARGCGALEAAAAAVTAVENRARDDMAPRDFGRLVPGFRCVSCPSSRGEARSCAVSSGALRARAPQGRVEPARRLRRLPSPRHAPTGTLRDVELALARGGRRGMRIFREARSRLGRGAGRWAGGARRTGRATQEPL
jgi:hypothetical protein